MRVCGLEDFVFATSLHKLHYGSFPCMQVLVQCDKTNEGRTDTPDTVRQVDLL